jgi:hypothetical protein
VRWKFNDKVRLGNEMTVFLKIRELKKNDSRAGVKTTSRQRQDIATGEKMSAAFWSDVLFGQGGPRCSEVGEVDAGKRMPDCHVCAHTIS